MAWTTDMLVEAVKRKVQAPSGGYQLTDTQILAIAFEATTKRYVPLIRGVHEDFFTTSARYAIVSGTASYRLPPRASSTTIKQVVIIDNTSGRAMPVPRQPVSQGYRGLGRQSATPWFYVIEGAQLRLVGTPTTSSNYTLAVYYQRRPSQYVLLAQSSVVGTASTSPPFIDVVGAPSWYALGDQIDVMSPEPEADLVMQSVVVNVAPATQFNIVDGQSPAQVTAGMYVAKADTTPVILLPDAFIHSLIDATAAECERSIGAYDSAASLDAEVESTLPQLLSSISVRAESQPLPIRNDNAGLYQRGRWYLGGSFS